MSWNRAAFDRNHTELVGVEVFARFIRAAVLVGAAGGLAVCALVGGVVVLALALFSALIWDVSATSRGTGALVDGAWSYEVPIERLETVTRDGWCRDAPADARIDRSEEHLYSDRVDRDGDVTRTYRQYCWWQADEWRRVDAVVAEGLLGEPLVIPVAVDDGCADLGCRRAGAPVFTGEVRVDVGSGEPLTCGVDEEELSALEPGGVVGVTISGFGQARCPVLPLPDVEPTPAGARR